MKKSLRIVVSLGFVFEIFCLSLSAETKFGFLGTPSEGAAALDGS